MQPVGRWKGGKRGRHEKEPERHRWRCSAAAQVVWEMLIHATWISLSIKNQCTLCSTVQNINHSTVSYFKVLCVFRLDEKGRGSEVKCANCAKAMGNEINVDYQRHKGCFDYCSQCQWFLSNYSKRLWPLIAFEDGCYFVSCDLQMSFKYDLLSGHMDVCLMDTMKVKMLHHSIIHCMDCFSFPLTGSQDRLHAFVNPA